MEDIIDNIKTIENSSYNLSHTNEIIRLIVSGDAQLIKDNISRHITSLLPLKDDPEVIFLYQSVGSIDDSDSDMIYLSLPPKNTKNIMLIISSPGGRIEPAYKISKCCKEYAKDKFIVSTPRRAKSAATLISLGADEIHMGSLSELGPIDPQINGLPALGSSSALEHLALLCKKYPESSNMFAEYLARTLPLHVLGYLERISVSAKDYAIRLLQQKKSLKNTAEIIAHKLAYEYKDHGFVIDKDEAEILFGDGFIKIGTEEYEIGNRIYNFLEEVNLFYRLYTNKIFNLIGSSINLIEIPLK